MDVVVYLANGALRRFVQPEEDSAATLATFQPARMFAVPTLIIGSPTATVLLATREISRVDLRTQETLPVPQGLGGGSVTVLGGESDFIERRDAVFIDGAQAVSVGEKLSGVIAYEMAGGHKLYGSLEAHLDSMAGVFNSMQHLLAQPVLAFNLPGGGATYINPINLVGITLHPGLQSLPRGSLAASLVE